MSISSSKKKVRSGHGSWWLTNKFVKFWFWRFIIDWWRDGHHSRSGLQELGRLRFSCKIDCQLGIIIYQIDRILAQLTTTFLWIIKMVVCNVEHNIIIRRWNCDAFKGHIAKLWQNNNCSRTSLIETFFPPITLRVFQNIFCVKFSIISSNGQPQMNVCPWRSEKALGIVCIADKN